MSQNLLQALPSTCIRYIHRTLKNLFCDIKNIELEPSNVIDIPELSNKFLLRRKYMLIIALCLQFASLIINIIDINSTLNTLEPLVTTSSFIKIQLVICINLIIQCSSILLTCCSIIHWKYYTKSSNYTLWYFMLTCIIDTCILYIPGTSLIEYTDQQTNTIDGYLMNLNMLYFNYPKLLLVQMSIMHVAAIVGIFSEEQPRMCAQMNTILVYLTALWIPIVLIVGSIVFVFIFTLDLKVIACVLAYIAILLIQVIKITSVVSQRVIQDLIFLKKAATCVFVFLACYTLYSHEQKFGSLIVVFLIRYIILGTVVRDVIIRTVQHINPECTVHFTFQLLQQEDIELHSEALRI